MLKKMKIIIVVLIAVIIVASLFAAVEMDIIEFDEDDDDDDNGGSGPVVDENPVAVIETNTTHAEINDPIAFSANGSIDKETNITSYQWNFDDGETSENATVDHNWTVSGAYNVTLTVVDTDGNTNFTWIYIGIHHRESDSGSIQSGSQTRDFDVGEMASKLMVNTTLRNEFSDPGSTEVNLSLMHNGTVVWSETVTSVWSEDRTFPYENSTNLSIGLWTWEIKIEDSGITTSVNWEIEIYIEFV